MELKIIGSPGNQESLEWARSVRSSSREDTNSGWLHFKDAIPRTSFSKEVSENGCFFHAYTGSLDKVLIEATMLRVPVVTQNLQYVSIFGSWSNLVPIDLSAEYRAVRMLSREKLDAELSRRLQVAVAEHSLSRWILKLTALL